MKGRGAAPRVGPGSPQQMREAPAHLAAGRRRAETDGPGLRCRKATSLSGPDWDHVLGARALLTLDDLELDLRALLERAVSLGLDVRVVHEQILTGVRRDEPEALGVVEPLHGAGSHFWILLLLYSSSLAGEGARRPRYALDPRFDAATGP